MRLIYVMVFLLLVSACSGMSSQEQALATEHSRLSTQIADVYQTATVEADRMLVTLEHAQTEVRRVNSQGTALASTLIAGGVRPDVLSVPNPAVTPDVAATPPGGVSTAVAAPLATEAALSASTDIPVTLFTLTPTENGPPRLSNIVLAEGVGDNDCALSTAVQFTTGSERIYVVAAASNIQPGITLTSRWYNEGVEQVVFDFSPDFSIDQSCIWFFIDQTDVTFAPGNWSVTLEIDGQPVGAPTAFTITG